jgi:two-component system NtrC family sensor kinase
LLDVRMPGMDGFEVLKRMKLDPQLQATPVVMISALDETASVVRCVQMGAEDYLMKPFDPVLLSARIGASLEKKRLRDGERRKTEELQTALDDLRRTQGQLLVQEKLASLGALTAGIAHEIKNPLNFVTNFASASVEMVNEIREILPPQPESAPLLEKLGQLQEYVAKIDEHGKRADRIVRGMLLHSRGTSGKPESVEVNDLLQDSLNLAYHGLRAHDRDFNLRFETSFDPAAGSVRAVPQELSRVFLNILNNACYAAWDRRKTEGNGFHPMVVVQTKTAHTKNCDAAIEIRIGDNGAGIPEAIRQKIFDPFFTTKPSGAGTGLGLSISHDIIVHRHHGTIAVESAPDHGTVFVVTLPRGPA